MVPTVCPRSICIDSLGVVKTPSGSWHCASQSVKAFSGGPFTRIPTRLPVLYSYLLEGGNHFPLVGPRSTTVYRSGLGGGSDDTHLAWPPDDKSFTISWESWHGAEFSLAWPPALLWRQGSVARPLHFGRVKLVGGSCVYSTYFMLLFYSSSDNRD